MMINETVLNIRLGIWVLLKALGFGVIDYHWRGGDGYQAIGKVRGDGDIVSALPANEREEVEGGGYRPTLARVIAQVAQDCYLYPDVVNWVNVDAGVATGTVTTITADGVDSATLAPVLTGDCRWVKFLDGDFDEGGELADGDTLELTSPVAGEFVVYFVDDSANVTRITIEAV